MVRVRCFYTSVLLSYYFPLIIGVNVWVRVRGKNIVHFQTGMSFQDQKYRLAQDEQEITKTFFCSFKCNKRCAIRPGKCIKNVNTVI